MFRPRGRTVEFRDDLARENYALFWDLEFRKIVKVRVEIVLDEKDRALEHLLLSSS